MSAVIANLSLAVGIILSGVALLLMAIGLLAYFRMRHTRMLWVSIAFFLFALQGALFAWDAYQTRGDPSFPTLPMVSMGIVMALYLAVLKR
jgi:hypothetical protein